MKKTALPTGDPVAEMEALRARIALLEQENASRQRIEQALRQSEELNRRITQAMPSGLVQITNDLAIVSANAQAQRILRLTYDELVGRYVSDFRTITIRENGAPFPLEEYPSVICIKTGKPQGPVTVGVRHPDDTIIWIDFTAAPLIDQTTAQVAGAVLTLADVTERHMARERLRQKDQQLLQAQQIAHIGSYDYDVASRSAIWSDEHFRLFGLEPSNDPVPLERFLSFVHFDDRAQVEKNLEGALAGRNAYDIEFRIIRADRLTRHIHERGELTFDALGKPVRIVGTVQDITQRREAEDARRTTEDRYRRLVEGVRLIAWEFDPRVKQFTFISHHAQDILGYSLESWRQKGFWYDRLHPDDRDRAANYSREHVSRGEDHEFEYRMVRANGEVIWIKDLTSVEMRDGKPTILHGVFIDITERKRSEEAKRQSIELQRMMLSELDHRVRNNLASLAALIDISMRDKTDVQEFASSIRGRVQAMSSVHSLLSRGHWIAVHFRQLIETLTPQDLQGSLAVDGPDIQITPRQVTALGMVLQELMANSLKYGALRTRSGKVEVRWSIDETAAHHSIPFKLIWRESHGPPILSDPTPGQGTGLIEGFVRTELRGTVELCYPREGAAHRFLLQLDPPI